MDFLYSEEEIQAMIQQHKSGGTRRRKVSDDKDQLVHYRSIRPQSVSRMVQRVDHDVTDLFCGTILFGVSSSSSGDEERRWRKDEKKM